MTKSDDAYTGYSLDSGQIRLLPRVCRLYLIRFHGFMADKMLNLAKFLANQAWVCSSVLARPGFLCGSCKIYLRDESLII
jgi:hypothetical protein